MMGIGPAELLVLAVMLILYLGLIAGCLAAIYYIVRLAIRHEKNEPPGDD